MIKIELVKFKGKREDIEVEVLRKYETNIVPMKDDFIVDPTSDDITYKVVGRCHNITTETLTLIVERATI